MREPVGDAEDLVGPAIIFPLRPVTIRMSLWICTDCGPVNGMFRSGPAVEITPCPDVRRRGLRSELREVL